MKHVIHLGNKSGATAIQSRPFKKILQEFTETHFGSIPVHLGFLLVTGTKMAHLNRQFLGHEGSTDVITLDYNDTPGTHQLCGDIFICPEVAYTQSRAFNTTFHTELVRYAVHGILHLAGYDDTTPDERKRMKKRESTLMKELSKSIDLKVIVNGRLLWDK